MTYGFKSITDSGIIQIDEVTPVYKILSSGTGTTEVDYPINTTTGAQLFIRGEVTTATYYMIAKSSGSTFQIQARASQTDITKRAFKYVWAAPSNSLPANNSGYGLIVRNSSGAITFNSNYRPFAVAHLENNYFASPDAGIAFIKTLNLPTPSLGEYYVSAGSIVPYYTYSVLGNFINYGFGARFSSATQIIVDGDTRGWWVSSGVRAMPSYREIFVARVIL